MADTFIQYLQAGWGEGEHARDPASRDDEWAAYWSSEHWLAFKAGQAIRTAGLPEPVRGRMSRGYSVRFETPHARAQLVRFDSKTLKPAGIDYA